MSPTDYPNIAGEPAKNKRDEMNQRNLSLAINKLLDVKQDIGDLLSEDPSLVTITEDHLSDAIDNLIGELYKASRAAFELRLNPPAQVTK